MARPLVRRLVEEGTEVAFRGLRPRPNRVAEAGAMAITRSVLLVEGSVTHAVPKHMAEHGGVVLVAKPGIDG
jgi:hypothetical protein